jgi:hypothetical protein
MLMEYMYFNFGHSFMLNHLNKSEREVRGCTGSGVEFHPPVVYHGGEGTVVGVRLSSISLTCTESQF